jgi:cytochrome b
MRKFLAKNQSPRKSREHPESGSASPSVRVWDLPTRVFHWTVVALVAVAWVSAEGDGLLFRVHAVCGYLLLAILCFRLIWGVVGSEHARFADFVRPWPAVRDYAKKLAVLSPPRHLGHNPLGGWMVVVLLTVLAAIVATGLFAYHDGAAGPFAYLIGRGAGEAVSEVHEGLTSVLGWLIALHVAAVFADWLITGDNLIRAMWTGAKTVPAGSPCRSIAPVPLWRLALAFVASVLVFAIVVA